MSIAFSIFPALSCTSFKILSLLLRSLIHFELILVQGDGYVSSFSFLLADIQFSQQLLSNRLFFSTSYAISAFVKNYMDIAV